MLDLIMTKFLFLIVIFALANSYALESEMTFTGNELKVSTLVQKNNGQDDEHLSVAGVRPLQLQVNAAGCNHAQVNPHTMQAAIQYKYTVVADNCVVKKKSEICDDGFIQKDMQPNPFFPEDVIVGQEKYKVCVKDPTADRRTGATIGSGAAAKPAAVLKSAPKKSDEELLKYFRK